jgi:hypothetical protein
VPEVFLRADAGCHSKLSMPMLMLCVSLQLGEKAGGPQIRECKQKQEDTERQMRTKIQQLKRAKQDRSVGGMCTLL